MQVQDGEDELHRRRRKAKQTGKESNVGEKGDEDGQDGRRRGFCVMPMQSGWRSEDQAARVVIGFLAALSCVFASPYSGTCTIHVALS